jgi:hypothetical protein
VLIGKKPLTALGLRIHWFFLLKQDYLTIGKSLPSPENDFISRENVTFWESSEPTLRAGNEGSFLTQTAHCLMTSRLEPFVLPMTLLAQSFCQGDSVFFSILLVVKTLDCGLPLHPSHQVLTLRYHLQGWKML